MPAPRPPRREAQQAPLRPQAQDPSLQAPPVPPAPRPLPLPPLPWPPPLPLPPLHDPPLSRPLPPLLRPLPLLPHLRFPPLRHPHPRRRLPRRRRVPPPRPYRRLPHLQAPAPPHALPLPAPPPLQARPPRHRPRPPSRLPLPPLQLPPRPLPHHRHLLQPRPRARLLGPLPPIQNPSSDRIIDRPPRFKQLHLRHGLNVKCCHRDYIIHFQELPEVSPYVVAAFADEEGWRWWRRRMAEEEKRACLAVLGMMVEKRMLVDHLTHLRKDFGLPNRLQAMLVRHPELFYVSVKGVRDSVFLVEAYNHEGKLLVGDELLVEKEHLLVGAGSRGKEDAEREMERRQLRRRQ